MARIAGRRFGGETYPDRRPAGGGQGDVITVTGTVPIAVDNTDPANPVVKAIVGETADMAPALGVAAAGASGKVLDAGSVIPAKTSTDFDYQNHDALHVRVGALNGVVDDGNSGAADSIDWTLGVSHQITLTANTTLTFSNPPPGPCWVQLRLTQDGTGGRTVTWPTMKWAGGIPPVLTIVPGGIDIVTIWYDGAAYYGAALLGFA